MKIGFDARLINETGVGRYIRNLLPRLIQKNKKNKWIITVRNEERSILEYVVSPYKDQVKIIEVNVRWHSFMEQLIIPIVFYKEGVDLLHVPYINVPVLFFKKMFVTIHDLTVLTNKTGRASTLNFLFYYIRRLGYFLALKKALGSAVIFVVTHSVKNEILDKFPKVDAGKIIVSYNGVSKFKLKKSNSLASLMSKSMPYFFYVGNAHPHKNLEFLIDTLDKFFKRFPKYSLIIAGRMDYFMRRLRSSIHEKVSKNNFIFIESPADSELYSLYKNSCLVILPSLKEGFGMQILEAMSAETLLVCSSIPAYREVGNNLCFYFDPESKRSLVLAINKALKTKKNEKIALFKKYRANLKRFNWEQTAKEVLDAYVDKKNVTRGKRLVFRN